MQMRNRHYVEGTDPAIYIGHRVIRRPNGQRTVSKYYHAEFTFDSRQRSKSLGTSNKNVAIRAAHALSEQVARGVEVRAVKKISVQELSDAYMLMQEAKGHSPKTVSKYRHNLNEFAKWWEEHSGLPAIRFTEQDFWAYRKWLKGEGKSDQTIEDRLIVVKQAFKWGAGKGGLLGANPLVNATVPEPPATAQPCFTPEQVEAILANAKVNERPVFMMLSYTGMRIGEVVALRWDDINFERGANGVISVRRGGSNDTTKGKRARYLPIHPELRKLLDSLPRSAETVFTRPKSRRYPDGTKPLNDRQLLGSIKRLCKKLGFANASKFKIHTFRHAFASMCARQQVSYKYALDWMGHKSSDILDMYVTQFDSAAEQAIGTINYRSTRQLPDSPGESASPA